MPRRAAGKLELTGWVTGFKVSSDKDGKAVGQLTIGFDKDVEGVAGQLARSLNQLLAIETEPVQLSMLDEE